MTPSRVLDEDTMRAACSLMRGSVVADGGLQGIVRFSRSYNKSDDIRCNLQGMVCSHCTSS